MHRLFVAIRPPPPAIQALMRAMGGISGARWQREDQLHLTLRFIGPVNPRQADDIAAALAAVWQPRFKLTLSGLGSFERRGEAAAA